MREFDSVEEFARAEGQILGSSEWMTIDQNKIDTFARATGDFQWIHVDPERAATGPFGRTIAHGYLTLSLIPALLKSVYQVRNVRVGVNYGANKVRFPSPVPVGSRIRAVASLLAANKVSLGTQFTIKVVVEREGADRPACVADVVYVLSGAASEPNDADIDRSSDSAPAVS